jgi:hypothetical protein
MKVIMTIEPSAKEFFNLPGKKTKYFKQKKEEENLGKRIATNVLKTIINQKEKEKNKD